MFKKLKNLLTGKLTAGVREWQNPDYDPEQTMCPEITLTVEPDLYERLLSMASASGARFDGNKATIEGLSFDWNYDLEAQQLHLTCTNKPFYASCKMIESRIRELLEKSKGEL